MGMKIRAGFESFEFIERDEYVLTVRDRAEAFRFLQGLRLDTTQMTALRNRFLGNVHDAKKLKDREVLELLAALMVEGQIRLLRRPHKSPSVPAGKVVEGDAQPGRAQSAAAPQAAKKNAWIEIKLITVKGQPVPRQRYLIKLPDGSVNEGRLNEFGEAEYTGINPGTCQVAFPDLENDDWGPA